jgi:FkbM family methyltransferase
MDKHDVKNFKAIGGLIKSGGIVVDVGAHTGTYCNFFLEKLGTTGKVYAVEIHPENYKVLYKNYQSRNNVILINKAASDKDGTQDIYGFNILNTINSYTTNIIGKDVNDSALPKLGTVRSTRLDTLLAHETKIDLIKIDVEGAEIQVLEGLSKIYDRVDWLLIECHLDKDWPTIKDILINRYGFSCRDIQYDLPVTIGTVDRAYQCLCKNEKT